MQCQETQFPRIPVGVAAPQLPRAGKAGDRVGLTCGSRRARLTWAAALCRPRHAGALCRGPAVVSAQRSPAAVPSRLRPGLATCRGGGDRRRPAKGRRAGAQVCSSTRAGRRTEQRRSGGWRRRTRRCHCRRRRLRATPGSPARPGAPRSTPLSTSGAPRRSSSLRRRTVGCSFRTRRLIVGCSFRTRPRRPSARPGKLSAQALQPPLLPYLLPIYSATLTLEFAGPTFLDGGAQRPGIRFTWHKRNGVQRGAGVASAGEQVPRGF